jgi:hypothetical protein
MMRAILFLGRPRGFTGDINHYPTESVFDELDRPFDENELDLCITKLKWDKSIGIDNIISVGNHRSPTRQRRVKISGGE